MIFDMYYFDIEFCFEVILFHFGINITQTVKCSMQTALQISHNSAGSVITTKILTFMSGR